jgi:DNA polymerase III subunit chi
VTTIDFYFNAPDRLQVACRLAGKAIAEGKRMLVYAPDAEVAARVDKLMWTSSATGFVPHCPLEDPLAPDTPILIGRTDELPPNCTLLLNLSAECPPHFASFERLFEVVGPEEADKEAGRDRYKLYRGRGYAIANHDLAAHDG